MRKIIILCAALGFAASVSGHHSDAGMDIDSVVTFEGTVTEYAWRNPHVYITVETTDELGEPIEWELQMSSTLTSTRMGWGPDSLEVGERVTAGAHPAFNGQPYGLLDTIVKEDGIALSTSFDGGREPELALPGATASTSTLEGRWIADTSQLVSYPGGLDGLFKAHLTLTEQAEAAQVSFNELSDENPLSSCIGMPTPVTIVTTNIYPLEIEFIEDEDVIMIRSEFFDEERTVYMDGRGHPDSGERSLSGHSIGRWDGDVLVVDTRNFADHRSPYQSGVPSGAEKHVVERYRLNEDGTRILVEFMLEDPEFIAEPMTHSRELIYSPQSEWSRFDCDLEATKRYEVVGAP